MIEIEKILAPIFEKYDVSSYKFNQKNKVGSISLIINKDWELNQSPNKNLKEDISKLEIVNIMFSHSFKQGKREENKNYNTFSFSIKKEFYNDDFNMGHYYGQMLSLMKNKNVDSIHSFFKETSSMIKNMSDYTHTLKFKEKLKYRETKLGYIETMYKLGFIESTYHQISYMNDNLVLFKTIFGDTFHLRKDSCDFINKELELLPHIYMKREIDFQNIDMEFMNYVSLLKNCGNENLFKHVELS